MPDSYVAVYVHIVFGVGHDSPELYKATRDPLYRYLATLIQSRRGQPVLINGTHDHLHLLTGLPKHQAIQDFVRDLKANSSRWLHETFPDMRGFSWQKGYGMFGVGVRGLPAVRAYIANQEAHHQERPFRDEVRNFLREQGVAFDEEHWG
ncbi:MAG: transposase [Armatimonadetes bacterium]|nr:transposase [Armatimonadota bacterium]